MKRKKLCNRMWNPPSSSHWTLKWSLFSMNELNHSWNWMFEKSMHWMKTKNNAERWSFPKYDFGEEHYFRFFPTQLYESVSSKKNIFSVKFCYAVSMWNFVISYSLFNTMNKCFGGSLNIIMNCCVCSENFKEVTLLIFLLNNLSLNKCRAYLN